MTTAGFRLQLRYDEDGVRERIIPGDIIDLPDGSTSTAFVAIYRTDQDGKEEFIYGVNAHDVRSATGLSEDELAEQHNAEQQRQVHEAWNLDAALSHLQAVLAPLPRTRCILADGDVLESGLKKCLTHNSPANEDETGCVAGDAFEFLARQGRR